jgi:hypothetical protein
MANSTRQLQQLEGQQVLVALRNGSQIDGCSLVSVGRGQVGSLWVFTGARDVFIPFADVVDVWPARPFAGDARRRHTTKVPKTKPTAFKQL